MTAWPDSAVEAAARAICESESFDPDEKQDDQGALMWHAYEDQARAALSTIDLAGVRGEATIAPLVWRDQATEKYGPEWIAHHPWGSWHITYEADCEYPYVLRPFVPIGSNFQAADAAMAAATQEHERRVRKALAATPPTPDPRDAEIARLRGIALRGLSACGAAYQQAMAEYQGHDALAGRHEKVVAAFRKEAAALAPGPDGREAR